MNILKIKNIKMVKKEYEKAGRKWLLINTMEKYIDGQFYQNIIDAKKFFQNLGGYERHLKNYTECGYIVNTVNSISPDKTKKSLYTFDFSTIN